MSSSALTLLRSDLGQTALLGEHVEILSGFAFDASLFSDTDGIPLIRIRDVVRGHTETRYRGAYEKKYLVQPGDLLVGMDGDFNRALWTSEPALLNQRVCKVTALAQTLDQRYLYHFLPYPLMDIWHQTPFATVKHLSAKSIKSIRIPLPSLAEQRRIATILDKTDELRAKRRQAIAHLDALTQSTFHSMFGSGVPAHSRFPIARMGDVLVSANYGTSERADVVGTVPVLRMGNITYSGQLDLQDLKYLPEGQPDKYLLRDGDVLFNRTNSPDLVGKTATFRGSSPMAYAGYLVRLRTSEKLNPDYLTTFMNLSSTKQLLRNMCKSIVGMANINAKEVQTIRLPVPQIELQQTFATRVAAVERLKEVHRQHLAELDTLFASLQHRAFKGEL